MWIIGNVDKWVKMTGRLIDWKKRWIGIGREMRRLKREREIDEE